MNKNSSSLFQKLVRFLSITLMATLAGFFLEASASADSSIVVEGGTYGSNTYGSTPNDSAFGYVVNPPTIGIDPNLGCAKPVIQPSAPTQTPGTILTSGGVSLDQNGRIISMGLGIIGANATLDLGGTTKKISSINLANGSKIINGTLTLRASCLLSANNPLISSSDVESELNGLGIFKDQNGNYDLNSANVELLVLHFKNGGQIVNGIFEIENDPALPVIQEVPSTSIIGYNPTEPSNALLVAGNGSTWRDTSTLVIGDISDDAHNSLTVVSPKSPTPSQNTASK